MADIVSSEGSGRFQVRDQPVRRYEFGSGKYKVYLFYAPREKEKAKSIIEIQMR